MSDVVYISSSCSGSEDEDTAAGAPLGGSRGAKRKKPHAKKKRLSKEPRMRLTSQPRTKKAKGGARAKSKANSAWTDSEEEGDSASGSKQAARASCGSNVLDRQIKWENWIANPPATMAFGSNLPATPPPYWAEKRGGNEAANLFQTMENCRLIGTIDLEFECIECEGKTGADSKTLLSKLHAPVKPTCPDGPVGNALGTRTWDENGEPGSRDCYTAHRLLRGCYTGLLLPKEASTISVLAGLVDLIRPDEAAGLPWAPQPLLRAVCPTAAAQHRGNLLKVRVWVYFRRLLFEMIAYPPLIAVMSAMTPAAPMRKTAALPPLQTPLFVSHVPADGSHARPDYAFSLAGIMKAQEHTGYRRATQPAGLRLTMKDYQLQTLAWMLDHEALPHGLNELFWEKWAFLDGSDYYYAPQLGELRLQRPLERSGGILSEEMGLGKTLEILALILATKKEEKTPAAGVVAVSGGGGERLAALPPQERLAGGAAAAGAAAVRAGAMGKGAGRGGRGRKKSRRKFDEIKSNSEELAADQPRNANSKAAAGGGARPEGLEKAERMPDEAVQMQGVEEEEVMCGGRAVAEGGTLIVVPVHLVSQWLFEIAKAAGDALSVTKYTAENKLTRRCPLSANGERLCANWAGGCPGQEGHLRLRVKELARADIVLTTYNMLKDDKATFNRIKWRRVVLDEMQEIRSSTTDHARACEKLLCDCRWMVSGTPLYTSIDDLNGELAFLGVLPFCASDSVDGFWSMRISMPFARRKPAAQQLLEALLRGVLMRHSKSQTYADGRSILDLPASSTRRVAVAQTASEKYIYQFLEVHAVADLDAAGGAAGSAQQQQQQQRGARTNFWLRLLREACLSPSLINGGAGCSSQNLKDLDFRLRAMGMGAVWLSNVAAGNVQAAYDPTTIRSLAPAEALRMLMQGRDVSETARHHKNHPHMVRHDNKQQGVYERNRTYAMPTVAERLVEVAEQRKVLLERINVARRDAPLLRWRAAVESITCGRYWDPDPSARISFLFLRRAFAAIRAQHAFARAERALQERAPLDKEAALLLQQAAPFSDRAKMKQALANSLPVGMRVLRVRALQTYEPATAEELAFKQDDVITICATTKAGWKALGFSWRPDKKYAPRSFFERDRDDRPQCDYLLLGALSAVVEDEAAVLEGESESAEIKSFKVHGDVGIVHAHMIKPLVSLRTSTIDIPSGRAANQREEQRRMLAEIMGEAADSIAKMRDLNPYYGILQRAHAAGAGQTKVGEDTIQQTGFQQLYEIELGQAPRCCICQEGCGYEQRPTFMRCAHFACEHCIVSWVMHERAKNRNRANGNFGGSLEATCPLCRKPFSLADLIRIIAPPAAAAAAVAAENGSSRGKGKEPADDEDARRSSRGAHDQESSNGRSVANSRRPVANSGTDSVSWLPACTDASLAQIPAPAGGFLARNAIQGLANLPSLTPELGTHLVGSCGVGLAARAAEACPLNFSSKVSRLLEDLGKVMTHKEKAVVFTQHKQGVLHLSRVFADARVNIGHVKIVGGDPQPSQEKAVKVFNEDESISVFLLHAGQAAAGLTLTAASHVFLMEPFMKAGEQAQAMNRCHRIGQTKDVTCTLYYAPDTIEERMEAWKEMDCGEESFGTDSSTDALSVLDHESKCSAESLVKIRYLMGVANDANLVANEVDFQRNNPEQHPANQLAGPSDDDD